MSAYGHTPGPRVDHTTVPLTLARDQHPDDAHRDLVEHYEHDLDHDLALDQRDRFMVDYLSERALARQAAA